ncbi:hypothetical protein [Paenarthrobacter nitroguajacolicus]|uniref:hypothetical protein n=1 Tax=Paenarthrobacter nitroguajacolicus TaxID=211146 RepID=UPI00248C964A|nr:hypothetical protein [Paenarthrobacter nitroguajacolicus]MDI2037323.1 hypothetical protein [Paenarthrobacter nitroguajacolicus]
MTHSSAATSNPASLPEPAQDPVPQQTPQQTPQRVPSYGAAGTALGAFGMAAVVGLFALLLNFVAKGSPVAGPSFEDWLSQANDSPLSGLQWFLGDMTEPLLYKSDLAALGLLAGAAVAWCVGRSRKCLRATKWVGQLSYGTGLWPWVLTSASLSLLLSNLAFGWMLDDGWQPTFVPFVCAAPAMVFLYGAGWRSCVTGAVLGAITVTPLALLFIPTVATPLGLPPVVGCVLAMAVGSAAAFAAARRLPWLVLRKPDPPAEGRHPASGFTRTVRKDAKVAARRVLKDFTETHFFANELASVGVILGVSVAFVLSPGLPSYGSALLPHILFAQALTSAAGVVLWRRWYRDEGWAASYASVVSVAPAAVLASGGSWTGIVGGAVLGAALAPPIARAISARLPAGFHPVIGNTAAMALSTAIVLPVLGLLGR